MITIQEAGLNDQEFIIQSQIAMAYESESMKLDHNTVSEGVSAVLKDSRRGKYYLAKIQNKTIACLLTLNEWSDWRNKNCLWIHSVYVVAEYRGQGIFKNMYQYLQNFVKEHSDYFGLRLYVEKENLAAIAVYEKLGMSKEHYDLYEWLE
jgi:RimJ/RimL family protein N-acetyltransferase